MTISEVTGCHLFWQMNPQWGSQKLLPGLVSHELTVYFSVFDLFLTQWIMAMLSKGCKPDHFESYNSLKLSFTTIWYLHSNFVECPCCPWIKLCWSSCSMWDKLGWLNWFWQILCKVYLPLIWKDSITHRLGLAVYVKEELLFARDVSLENSVDSYWCLPLALLHSMSSFLSSINHRLCFYAQFLILFHLT